MTATIETTDVPHAQRFEIRADGELVGFADYRDQGSVRTFPHTEVFPAFGGRGYGTRLVEDALGATIASGMTFVPQCPFVMRVAASDPELQRHEA